jgi:signal transduction histidine kinase
VGRGGGLGLIPKSLLLVGGVVVLTLVPVFAVVAIRAQQLFVERARTESLALAKTTASAVANAVLLKEYAFVIEHCLLVVRSRPDLRFIVVVRREGESLIHTVDGWRAERLSDPVSRQLAGISEPTFLRHESPIAAGPVLEAAHPITLQRAHWGVIRLGFSVVPLQEDLRSLNRRVILVGSVALAVTLLVVAVTVSLVVRPIVALTGAARTLAAGDLSQRVAAGQRDEIGELGAAFNKMAAELESALKAERTRAEQLAQVNAELRVAQDEQQRAQARALEAGRLASIGQLAAGVAHELNNPLSVVLTYSLLLREDVEALGEIRADREPLSTHLRRITDGAERCKTIADNLLAFSRQSEGVIGPVPLSELVQHTLDLIGTELARSRIKLEIDIPDGLQVWGSASQLQQVLTNLTLNAKQAIQGEGRIAIRARAEDEEHVLLEVQDSGPGIAPQHLDQIFDPFFTTKPVGQGTGLGLSIVHGIVSQHRGEITAESEPGQGARFRLRLPTRAVEEKHEKEDA